MKARIVDIEENEVTMKTEKGKFISIPRKKIKFDCHLSQDVIVEKNDDKIYILPEGTSLLDEDKPK